MERFGQSWTGYTVRNFNGTIVENRPAQTGAERAVLAQVAGSSSRHEGLPRPHARRLAAWSDQVAFEHDRRRRALAALKGKKDSDEEKKPGGRKRRKAKPTEEQAPATVERVKSAKRRRSI